MFGVKGKSLMLVKLKLNHLFCVVLMISLCSCSAAQWFKSSTPPDYFAAVVLDARNITNNANSFQESASELMIFLARKPSFFGNHTNELLQDLASKAGESKYTILSCYDYNMAPGHVINDKIELLKDSSFAIIFLRKENKIIDKSIIKIVPKKTKMINIELIGNRMKITKNI